MVIRKNICAVAAVLMMAVAPAALRAADADGAEAKAIAVLKSDAPVAQKVLACRQLKRVGTAVSVPVLAGLLGDKDLSHMARFALEPMPFAEAGDALRAAVGSTSGELKVGAIDSVGFRREEKAVPELIPLLKDEDGEIAAAAAGALGRIGSSEAAGALHDFAGFAPEGLQRVAAESSLAAAQRLLLAGKADEAGKIYEEFQGMKWPKTIRIAGFVGMLSVKPAEAPAKISAAIGGKDSTLATAAIASIATLQGPGITEAMSAELPKAAPDAEVLLIGALAQRGDVAARGSIETAAGSNNAEVRTAAVTALATLGNESSVDVLCKAIAEGKSADEKQAATLALRRIKGSGIDAVLVKSLQGASADAKPALIRVLVARQATGAVPALLAQAHGADAAVRSAAFDALGALADAKDIDAIVEILVGLWGDGGRAAAERAVVAVARKIPDETQRHMPATEALKAGDVSNSAKCSLLRVLGGIGNDGALQVVAAHLADTGPEQDAAIRALTNWPNPTALPALLMVPKVTENATYRTLALQGCVRLLELGGQSNDEAIKTYTVLLKGANRPEERKIILGGLANVASPEAFKLVEPLLGDADVRNEAELAMVNIAGGCMGWAPVETSAVAKKLAAEAKGQSVRDRASQILAQIDKLGDFVTAWQVSGPYTHTGASNADLYAEEFSPEAGGHDAAWKLLPAGAQNDKPWMMDLLAAIGGESRVAYVRTWVHSEKAQTVRLEFGTDDGHKAWLNGKLIHEINRGGAAVPGEFKVPLKLHAGWNTLMLKIIQDSGPWEFCVQIVNPKDWKGEGVRVQPSAPAE